MPHPAGADRPSNWYAVLGVDRAATTEQITAAVERLARHANALSLTAPERARRLRDQVRAIKQELLSGTEQRERYDQQLGGQEEDAGTSPPPPPAAARASGLMSRVTQFLQAGWTCPDCGYGALPTDRFCPKCGSKIQSGVPHRPAKPTYADAAAPGDAPAAPPPSCAKCGGPIASGDAFCTRCGALRSAHLVM
jgi:rubrerythrin